MNDLVNPYIAGAPVTEARMFFGREDVFDWIQNSLTGLYADHALVIHGQRRVGKTSVLKQLGNRLPKKYIPVFFDLQGRTHTTLDRFLWWLAREICRVLKQDRDISFPVPEKEVFTGDMEYFDHRFLPELRTILGGNVLLLTFDEFDNLEESEIKEELAVPLIDYLRRLMGQEGLNFIFSIGSSGRKLENMQAAYTEFFKTALYKKISFLSRDQSASLITRPVEGILEYDPQAVDRIYDITSGHPYFIQLTCHELFSGCQQTGDLSIREKDVEAVLEDVVERGTVNLKFVWDEASDIEKWILASLAHLNGKPDISAISDFLRKQRLRFSESDLTSGVLHLREKDILTDQNCFVIYLLKLWLKRNRPIDQVREELTEVNPIANRYIEIGLEFQDGGQYEKAIENFREALAVAPEHVQAQVNISQVYMAQQAFSQAVVEFEKALAMDDEDVAARAGLCGAYLALGDAALAKNKTKDAIAAYQKVLDINAEHTEARQHMAEILRQKAEKALAEGRDEEALAFFSEALKFTPEDPALAARFEQVKEEKRAKVLGGLLARAEKEQTARNWTSALETIQYALELDPANAKAAKELSLIKAAQHQEQLTSILARADRAAALSRWGLVIAGLEEYLKLEPGDGKVQARLDEAQKKLRDARLDEVHLHVNDLTRQEKFPDALALLQESLQTFPDETQQLQSEIESVNKAQALAATYFEAQQSYAKKHFDQAVSLLKGIINQDENYKDASRLLAQAIEIRRTTRKWWQNRWLWAGFGFIALVALGWLIYPLLKKVQPAQVNRPTPMPTQVEATPLPTLGPASPPPTWTALPTAIPFTWSRLNSGQFLPRDPITAIVIDPNDPGVMYIATQDAGIYKSIDAGVSWQPVHNGLGRAAVFSLIMDPRDTKILYAGTQLGGIYKTIDGGLTWQAMNAGVDFPGSEWVAIVVIDAQNSHHLYFTDASAIYETLDGGQAWQKVEDNQSCPGNFVGLVADPFDANILYTAEFGGSDNCQAGVYKSLDGGRTWTITTFKMQPEDIAWNALWIEPNKGQTLFASSSGRNLWISNDKGETWTEADKIKCLSVVFDAQDPLTAYCSDGTYIMKTTSAGKKWSTAANLMTGDQSALAISPQDSDILFLGASGLFKSKDGGLSWAESNYVPAAVREEIQIDPLDKSLFNLDNNLCQPFQSSDGGRSWTAARTEGCRNITRNSNGTEWYWLDKNEQIIHTSMDSGVTWQQYPLPEKTQKIIAHPTQPDRLYAICGSSMPARIYVSRDYGKTWHASSGIEKLVNGTMSFRVNQDQLIYAVSMDNHVYRSEDYGESWKMCTQTGVFHTISENRMVIDLRDDNRLILATRGNGVLISQDGCNSWQFVSAGLGSLFVNNVATDLNHPDTIYAATDGGAYVSLDNGNTWGQVNDGLLGATVVYSIVVDKDSNVYGSTPYGVFRLEKK